MEERREREIELFIRASQIDASDLAKCADGLCSEV